MTIEKSDKIFKKNYSKFLNIGKFLTIGKQSDTPKFGHVPIGTKSDAIILICVRFVICPICLISTSGLDKYGLDPLWYYSTPGLAWDALFLTTGQKLELITNQDMYMMIEQGLRGGISMVSRRYAKANNPGMGEGKWNADKLKTYLLYLDANNLYGWAMMQYLPTGGFCWVRDEYSLNKLKNQVNNGLIKDDADEGYILRVKLRYPEN